ncbi:hypothetical protein SDC9_10809 [bioreactor metagenome]|uniref:Uncharacterized protein n=1 Tax=bioreactor metagenome TaxID=1076179 RepID=A0A644TDU5_9ZZZZ
MKIQVGKLETVNSQISGCITKKMQPFSIAQVGGSNPQKRLSILDIPTRV